MARVLVLAVFVVFIGAVRGADLTYLTDEDFEEFVQNNKFVLVEFYAPW